MKVYSWKNNDISSEFTKKDIAELGEGRKVCGDYVDIVHGDKLGEASAIVDDKTCKRKMELVTTMIRKDVREIIRSIDILISDRAYQSLNGGANFTDHQGYRHVELIASSQ